MDKPCPIIPPPKQMELTPTSTPWPPKPSIQIRNDLPKIEIVGQYEIELNADEIILRAGDEAGIRHATSTINQLASEPFRPMGRIRDWPRLNLRGFHINFEAYRRLDFDAAMRLLQTAAKFKLNTLLIEYGPRFPFTSHPVVRDRDALIPDQIAALNKAAKDHGIELIPLQQSLAHLEYLLKHDSFAPLRERAGKVNLLCPSHPDSPPLIKTLLTEIIAAHPHSKFLHLGGDEARKIGECPRCRPLIEREGVGPLFGRFMGDLARWALEQGRRPIVWDDTFCAHPDALDHLPKETIIAYWDYIAVTDPTPILIPRMAHAAGGPRVAHDWHWSVPGRSRKLSPLQQGIMSAYSKPARLKSALGKDFTREFSSYLGADFPKWIRALPYLEYYLDRGFDVITCPTGMGNGDTRDGVPNFERFDRNIALHAARCAEQPRALGIITTCWYNMPPEMLYQPLIRTAIEAW